MAQNDTLRRCAAAPPGSLGAEYHAFMTQRHFEADARPAVRFVDDEELAYVATRVREVHDLWHVIFDCHTNVYGETALKGLEFIQVRMPRLLTLNSVVQHVHLLHRSICMTQKVSPGVWAGQYAPMTEVLVACRKAAALRRAGFERQRVIAALLWSQASL